MIYRIISIIVILITFTGCSNKEQKIIDKKEWMLYKSSLRNYSFNYPNNWNIKELDASSISFNTINSEEGMITVGGINELGRYYRPNEILNIRPNHSETKDSFELSTSNGPVSIFSLERSEGQKKWLEQRAYIPGPKVFFEIWLMIEDNEVHTINPTLARLVQGLSPE